MRGGLDHFWTMSKRKTLFYGFPNEDDDDNDEEGDDNNKEDDDENDEEEDDNDDTTDHSIPVTDSTQCSHPGLPALLLLLPSNYPHLGTWLHSDV